MKLRDYQEETVRQTNVLLSEHGRLLVILCTGAGKTVVVAFLVKQYLDDNKSVMFIAHRQELISQASMTFAALSIPHKLICPKPLESKIRMMHLKSFGRSFLDPFSAISIGSAQTVVRRLDHLSKPDLLIIDEAAHAVSNLWRKTIDHFDTLTLGVTATPTRSDRQSLGEVFNYMYIGKDMKSIVADGQLCPYVIYSTPEQFDLSEVKRVRSGENKGDYNRGDLEKQMDKPKIVGRAVEHYEKYAKGKSAMVFAVSVKHSEHIAEEFCQHGYKFISIDGTTDDAIRYKAFQDLKSKAIDGIVNVDIAGEGVSVDGVEVVIMMRPISELAFGLYAQQIGRALRLAPGKDKGIIIDMVSNAKRHGFVEDKTDWTLWEGEEKSKRGPKDEDTVKVKTCPECFMTHPPAPMCMGCGYVYPVMAAREYEQVEGELVEMQREYEIAQLQKQRAKEIKEATTTTQLAAIDARHGHKQGAAQHRKKAQEAKREAMKKMSTGIRYVKQYVCGGDIELFNRLMVSKFEIEEHQTSKLSTSKATALTDNMREFCKLFNAEIGGNQYGSDRYRQFMDEACSNGL